MEVQVLGFYEGMYILDSSLSDDGTEELIRSIRKELGEKGEVFSVERLGKRQLTHPVRNMTDGNYVVIHFSCDPSEIQKLNSRYSLNSSIIRVMIIKRKEAEIRMLKEKLAEKTEAEKPETAESAPRPVSETAPGEGQEAKSGPAPSEVPPQEPGTVEQAPGNAEPEDQASAADADAGVDVSKTE
jgi:small subunit ribosomal protein S6